MKKIVFTVILSFSVLSVLFGQYRSKYPDIPIVDVHVHPNGANDASNFIKVGETLKQKYGSNLAFWIALSNPNDPLSAVLTACNNRMLFAVSEMRPHRGLTVTAGEVVSKVREGFVGLKFWFGAPYRVLKEGEQGVTRIDDPAFERFFATLERENVLLTSLHIADPNGPFDNRQNWMADPVYYWEQIRAFENVVAKYPKLTIIAAHGAWLVCQDAQIDYLRYMFTAYPNLYIDLSATFQYMSLLNPDNLRDFIIEYQDRILYGTDGGRVADNAIGSLADRYANTFAILETDLLVEAGFFGNAGGKPIQGLNLPREVLEKIYYRNALKLYPGLKVAMGL